MDIRSEKGAAAQNERVRRFLSVKRNDLPIPEPLYHFKVLTFQWEVIIIRSAVIGYREKVLGQIVIWISMEYFGII